MPSILLILTSLICVLCAYLYWQKRKRLDEPPLYPGAWPIVGHILSCLGRKRLWNFVQQMAMDIGHGDGVCSLLAGPVKLYVVCNPNDSLTIANQCLEKSFYYKFAKPWVGDSLITSESIVWKKDRKMLLPAFKRRLLEGFLQTFNNSSREVIEKLSAKVDKGSFDHMPYISGYSIDSLCKTMLGIDISKKQKYIHVVETIMDIIVKRFINPFLHNDAIYGWTNYKKTEKKCIKYCNDISDELIMKKRSETKAKSLNNTDKKMNFLDLLYHISNVEAMTDEKMRYQLNLIITAGFDTISVALRFIIVLIGSNENVQKKLYKEIVEVLGETSRDIERSDLDRLVYLEAVIKEIMRLYPPVPIVVREITEDIKLEKYTLYAGHSCMLLLCGLNLHPVWGDDAQLFKPERWLDPATLPNHSAVFAAFSIGRRNCIGKYYAMISMKSFIVHIIRNFIITADCTKLDLGLDIILRFESEHHIRLQRRS